MSKALLSVKNLSIHFSNRRTWTNIVDNVTFDVAEGEVVAILGESGSGKTITALALTRLLPEFPASRIQGSILYDGTSILDALPRELYRIRGKEIAYIFQDPSTSLNPVLRVGDQIAEAIKLHFPREKEVRKKTIELLKKVKIDRADLRYDAYPHELSGGMQQRIMIAMALACQPKILVADEPTTALDVTIQKEIIELLKELKCETRMSIILITHNFTLVSHFADRILVMFRGQVVERGKASDVLRNPQHIYTKSLINCVPQLGQRKERLPTIDYALLNT